MVAKKAIAVGVLVTAAVGIAALLLAVPPKRRLTLYWEGGTDPAVLRHASELIESPVARLLDPQGHANLVRALAIEARIAAGGSLQLDEIDPYLNVTWGTDHHQIAIQRARIASLITLGFIFASTLIGLMLWLRDSRSGLWLVSSTLLLLTPIPLVFMFPSALWLGVGLAALAAIAFVNVVRQSVVALRLRTHRELA
jgi:hypothetical protein